MTLDEGIIRAEDVAKELDKLCKRYDDASGYTRSHNEDMRTTDAKKCAKCANEHRQLAEWLKELKSLKEKADDIDEVGMANIKLALNDGAVKHIKKICNKSDCGKCPYTLKKMSCIFSVCPMDWEVNDEND